MFLWVHWRTWNADIAPDAIESCVVAAQNFIVFMMNIQNVHAHMLTHIPQCNDDNDDDDGARFF